jgi:tRNA-binding protein
MVELKGERFLSMKHITWQDFEKVVLLAGTITRVEDFPEAHRPAYRIWADFGRCGVMKSSAQITKLYAKEDLLKRQIIGVINFPPKQISTFKSEFLVTGFVLENGEVVLAEPERPVPNGAKLA